MSKVHLNNFVVFAVDKKKIYEQLIKLYDIQIFPM